ncbi:hypothetical protein C8J57DRAFT_1504674 [Mycena rebaudengoi]|nr:hypothetical protein C8J57DRAFT_1504674 [Mycena rebaudengoi]
MSSPHIQATDYFGMKETSPKETKRPRNQEPTHSQGTSPSASAWFPQLSETLLPTAEENGHKIDIANAIVVAHQADLDLINSLIQGAVAKWQASKAHAVAQEAEAQKRMGYYHRPLEVAEKKFLEAEMRAGKIS